ncbi:MAG: DUF1328 domain-containing protein [Alphaproteobacteria bacterium]|nr:DUF1328 domain-containing protein [Alphaproteobacteria bacterium]
MLGWALMFLLVADDAGILGFGVAAAVSTNIAQVLFFIFLIAFVVSLIVHLARGRTPPM